MSLTVKIHNLQRREAELPPTQLWVQSTTNPILKTIYTIRKCNLPKSYPAYRGENKSEHNKVWLVFIYHKSVPIDQGYKQDNTYSYQENRMTVGKPL